VVAKRLKNYVEHLQDALLAIKGGRIPPPGSMASLEEIGEILGFDTYEEEEKRYATSSSDRGETWKFSVVTSLGNVKSITKYMFYPFQEVSSSSVYRNQRVAKDDPEQREDLIVEVITPEVYNEPRNPFSRIWSRSLRIKIIGRDGFEKLDVRIPVSPLSRAIFRVLSELMQNLSYGWNRPDSWKVSQTLFQVFKNS